MSRESTFFYLYALFLLWVLSLGGGIAAVLSWIYVDAEYDEEGLLTRDSHFLTRARILLTVGCAVFWVCTILGHALSGSGSAADFGFWQDHPMLLVTLFFLADILLITSAVFAWQARGGSRWILSIATPVLASSSVVASFVLFMSATSASASSF